MLERLLIDKIENRILVGTVMFLGIMLLVGWVAINENGRMTSFENQFEARAIERGAALFNTNCTSCHGVDGRGGFGVAPALNSPHLFGYDFFADVNREISTLESELSALAEEQGSVETAELEAEREALTEEAVDAETSEERFEEIQARLDEIATLLGEGGESTSSPEMVEIEAQLEALYQQRADIANQLQPAVDAGYPLELNDDGTIAEYEPSRLGQLEFASTIEDYLFTTLVHGRPGSGSIWPEAMVSWSQLGGGSLRTDQLNDIVAFIMNWDRGDAWTIDDALAVNQYGRLYGDLVDEAAENSTSEPAGPPLSETHPGIEYDTVQAIVADFATVTADATAGEAIYTSLGCGGCHSAGVVGPLTAGTGERVANERLTLGEFSGYTAQEYIVESIINPSAYSVSGYAGAMPGGYNEQLSLQDIADLVEYLETIPAP